MPETTAQRSAAAKKGAATHKARERERARQEHAGDAAGRSSELSDEVLKQLESGSRSVIEAIRKFVDVVDEALPALPHGERPSRRREIVDAAMDMSDRLVKTQYEFLRNVVQSAGTAIGQEDEAKK